MKKYVASAGALFALVTISVVDGSGHQYPVSDAIDPWTAQTIKNPYYSFEPKPVDWEHPLVIGGPVKKSKPKAAKVHHPPAHAVARQVPAPVAPAKRGLPGFNFDPGQFAVNQVVNLIPGPTSMLGGMAFGGLMSGTANILYSAAVTSIKEDRELGLGEAYEAFLSGLIPFIGGYVAGPITDAMLKNYDDCKDPNLYRALRDDDPVPRAARVAWFLYKYCHGPEPHEYDALLAQAGIKRLARFQPKQ